MQGQEQITWVMKRSRANHGVMYENVLLQPLCNSGAVVVFILKNTLINVSIIRP